jgi:hypothetical protein
MSKLWLAAIAIAFLLGFATQSQASITFAFTSDGTGIAQFMTGALISDPTTTATADQALAFQFPATSGSTAISGHIQMGEVDIFNATHTTEIAVLRFTDAAGDLHGNTGTEMFLYLPTGTGTEASTGFPTTTVDSSATVISFDDTAGSKPNVGSLVQNFWYVVPTSTASPGQGPVAVTGAPSNPYQYVDIATAPEAPSVVVWSLLIGAVGIVMARKKQAT